jgi:hypothetical protein
MLKHCATQNQGGIFVLLWLVNRLSVPRGGIGGELARLLKCFSDSTHSGAIAQLGERIVRNDEVVGSIPTSSTIFFKRLAPFPPA